MRVKRRGCSPLHNSNCDPYASGDRRTDLRISTQVCRDFPPGKCRRGSDCHVARFFHPNAANHGDGGQSEDNLAERLSSRPECGHISTYTESEGRIYQIKG